MMKQPQQVEFKTFGNNYLTEENSRSFENALGVKTAPAYSFSRLNQACAILSKLLLQQQSLIFYQIKDQLSVISNRSLQSSNRHNCSSVAVPSFRSTEKNGGGNKPQAESGSQNPGNKENSNSAPYCPPQHKCYMTTHYNFDQNN